MLEKTNSKIFTFLLGSSALLVAAAAAIFSVTGLSMLYSGEMLYVAIAMGALEFAKIITASFLYRYWKTTGWGLKTYLSIAVLVLMLVTSGGIYGYLTNSYQGATIGLEKINSQTQVLEQRKLNYTDERDRLKVDLESLRNERRSIIDSRAAEIERNNSATDSNSVKYNAYRNRRVREQYKPELDNIDAQIAKYMVDLDSTNVRLSRANDAIADQKLDIINTGVDVGPLVYMARIFNTTMDNVMKWFTLVIVFVFDPLAIALIVAYNSVIMKGKKEKEYGIITEPGKEYITNSKLTFGDISRESEKEYDIGIDPALPGEYSAEVYMNQEPDEDEDDEIILDKPDDLSFMKHAKSAEQSFDDIEKKIKEEKDFLQEIDDEIEEMEQEVEKKEEVPELIKPLDDLVEEIKEEPTKDIVVPMEPEPGHELLEDFIEKQVELDEDFAEALNETTKKVGKEEPIKERLNPIVKKKLDELDKEFEETERIVLEPAKSGDIPKEKIKEAVDKVKHQNEFFDKMREEKKDETEFQEEVKKKKTLVSNEEIRAFFEDAVRKVKKDGQGIVTRTPFQAGGSVNVDHLQDDPDTDYSIQE
jgi:hypothetical protein